MWWKRQIRSRCHYSNYFSSRIPVECPGDLQGPQTALWDLLVSWISCICFGPSGSVALNSQVISLVLKIKSNIIQKSISGPFSISQGSCHDSPYMHEYSLPTPVLFTSLKVPEPFLCRDTLYAMLCFVLLVFLFWEILFFMSYLTNSYSFFKCHTSNYFPGETAAAATAKSFKGGLNELPRILTAISIWYFCVAQGPNVNT